MLRQLKDKEDGVVIVTVLIILLVMMTLTISMISMNVNQTLVSEDEVRRIQAEVLTIGGLSLLYANQISSSPGSQIINSITLDNIVFDINATLTSDGSGPLGTNPINVTVSF